MRKIAGYLTKNRSGKDQKIAQSTHENEYIKPRKTFWRNSKQFLTFAVTRDHKSHVLDFPLNKLEDQLDPQTFFRANRQYILSADSIRSIQNHFNGKAVIRIEPSPQDPVYISRDKVPLLKLWLNK